MFSQKSESLGSADSKPEVDENEPLLKVRDLSVVFRTREAAPRRSTRSTSTWSGARPWRSWASPAPASR